MYYSRAMAAACHAAAEQFPVLFLSGPRQVGKTTLLRRLAGRKRRYVTLDDPALRALAVSDPDLFLQRFTPPVLIDEIQYAPELLPLIKLRVDAQRRPGEYWLTGSQQFHLMARLSESLAGRVAILSLLGFSQREARRRGIDAGPFLPTAAALDAREPTAAALTLGRLYSAIWRGAFPALVARQVRDRDLFYGSYVQTYLERDVRALAQVGDEAAFLRFLKACAARTAQLLNFSELARDADVAVNTAKHWLSILQSSFQVYLLPPYHSNVTKRLVKTPKLYFLDTGLCAYLTEWTSPRTLEAGAMSGAILETFVFGEVLKSWWNRGKQPALYFYRDKERREIDLLIAQDRALYPIEVKKSATPRPEWSSFFKPLDALKRSWPEACVICLHRERMPLSRKVTAAPVGML